MDKTLFFNGKTPMTLMKNMKRPSVYDAYYSIFPSCSIIPLVLLTKCHC